MIEIGAWAQPNEHFKRLKSEGVTVVIGNETGKLALADYNKRAADEGLKYISVPVTTDDWDRMNVDPACRAIGLPDEPENNLPAYNSNPAGFKTFVDDWMARYAWIAKRPGKKKPLYLNFNGTKVTAGIDQKPPYAQQNQAPFAALTGPGDIISQDWYPIATEGVTGRYKTSFPGQGVQCLKTAFPGREYWAYMETTYFDPKKPNGRLITLAEMEEELAGLLAQGVAGISWFTHQFSGLSWDVTASPNGWDARNPEIRAKCVEIARRLNPVVLPPPPPPPVISPEVLALQKDVALLQASVKATQDLLAQTRAEIPTAIELKKGL